MGNTRSPEQIARRLPVDFPDDETMRISHEVIYQALFVQGRGALWPRTDGLLAHRQRRAEAADRAMSAHWEGDLILGLVSSAIGT